jgi:hypothetical protein
MTCQEFQRKWNELLDAEAVASAAAGSAPLHSDRSLAVEEAEALLLAHAAECPGCRPVAARYQVLRQAIRVWRQPPAPPSDLVERILSTPDDLTPGTWRSATRQARGWWRDHQYQVKLVSGLAAAVLVCMTLPAVVNRIDRHFKRDVAVPVAQTADRDRHSVSHPRKTPDDPRDLNRALAEATSATLDLARLASEPAARISRDMLDVTAQGADPTREHTVGPTIASVGAQADAAGGWVSVPTLDPLAPDATASAVLEQVGDQLAAGVEPLSDTARHAFGFLLAPPRARADSRNAAPPSNGARSG